MDMSKQADVEEDRPVEETTELSDVEGLAGLEAGAGTFVMPGIGLSRAACFGMGRKGWQSMSIIMNSNLCSLLWTKA